MTMTKNGKEISGYRIQPLLPVHIGAFGGICDTAEFSTWEGKPCVTARMRLGLAKSPYVLHLSIEQALAADIIEKTE
jgi:hypothetical protein